LKKYQQETTEGITETNEQQDNGSEETSETEQENIKQVVTKVKKLVKLNRIILSKW
jgi:hypothetical protein